MNPRLTLAFLFLIAGLAVQAQTIGPFASKGTTGLNFSQTGFNNWAGGGENAVATTAYFNLSLDQVAETFTWNNYIDVAYGLVKQGEKDFRKAEDKLTLQSKIGRKLNDQWNLTGLLELKTQFDAGFKYETKAGLETKTFVSRFMSPGYVNLAIGFDYVPLPNLSVFMTPATGKATYVLDDVLANVGAYGVDPGENALYEFGAYLNAKYTETLMENVSLLTKLNLFSSYEKLQYIDVNWENLISMKINTYLSASISTTLMYDDDIVLQKDDGTMGRSVQFKEVIGLGLSYTF